MAHTVSLDEMLKWLDDTEHGYVTFASSSREPKRLEVRLAAGGYRVSHGGKVVYEGTDGRSAVDAYNAIGI